MIGSDAQCIRNGDPIQNQACFSIDYVDLLARFGGGSNFTFAPEASGAYVASHSASNRCNHYDSCRRRHNQAVLLRRTSYSREVINPAWNGNTQRGNDRGGRQDSRLIVACCGAYSRRRLDPDLRVLDVARMSMFFTVGGIRQRIGKASDIWYCQVSLGYETT
jgi:hypothetical protein